MAKSLPGYLKLYNDSALAAARSEVEYDAGVAELCDAFSAATGWPLQYEAPPEQRQDPVPKWSAPENPGVGTALGHLRMDLGDLDGDWPEPTVGREPAERLAAGISHLVGQLSIARRAVWQREAELAAGVPVVARGDESKQLAAQLSAVLKAGALACDAQAAALYMLDETTSELKLRAAFGLPIQRLMQPPRPLDGALADLEALLGHAVALERAASYGPWRVPEEFPAALCVPVSTAATPLGTLWFFSDRERDFTDTHTRLAEMTAGRLAAELERAMLITAQIETTETVRELEAARRLQQSQSPQPIRLVEEGWELAGRCASAGELGGAFYDWCWLPGDALAVMIGETAQTGVAGALTAATIRSAVSTLTEQGLSPGDVLAKVNRSLWFKSGGDEAAMLVFGIIELATGRMRFSWAGEPSAIRCSSRAESIPLAARPALGTTADAAFAEHMLDLAASQSLVICTRPLDAAAQTATKRVADLSAEELTNSWANAISKKPSQQTDRGLVAIKRLAHLRPS